MQQKHSLILFLLAIPLLGYNQCKTEFCRVIQAQSERIIALQKLLKEKDAQIKSLRSTIANQEQIIRSQQQTINGLKKIITIQKRTIDSLRRVNTIGKQAELKVKALEDSLLRIEIGTTRLNDQIKLEQSKVQTLTIEKEGAKKTLDEIKSKNFIFDTTYTYIVPYGLPIGPIKYNDNLRLDPPDPESYQFLQQLRKTPKEIDVVIEINVLGKRRQENKLKEALLDQMKNFCPSCRFTFQFTPANIDQVYLKLYNLQNAPPPTKP